MKKICIYISSIKYVYTSFCLDMSKYIRTFVVEIINNSINNLKFTIMKQIYVIQSKDTKTENDKYETLWAVEDEKTAIEDVRRSNKAAFEDKKIQREKYGEVLTFIVYRHREITLY